MVSYVPKTDVIVIFIFHYYYFDCVPAKSLTSLVNTTIYAYLHAKT